VEFPLALLVDQTEFCDYDSVLIIQIQFWLWSRLHPQSDCRSTSFTSFTFTHLILVSCVVFSFAFAGRHSNISFSRVFSVTHTHTHTHTLVQPVRLTRRLSSSQRKHREQILRNTHSLCKWDAHTHLPHRHSDGKRSYWEMFDCVYSHINEINVLLLKAGVELV